MPDDEPTPFTYDGGRVDPGEHQDLRYGISETYLGDPIRVPVTIVNGDHPGPTVLLAAAAHGDELNGIEVVRTVAHDWDHAALHGTLVCLPVLNVPGFLFQERYLPVYDRDLNRAFPGSPTGTSAKRIAHELFRNFIEPCDLALDFHTSTRGRHNMLHVRADMTNADVARLAKAFGTNVIIDGDGPSGSLRAEATAGGVPTIAIEMGEAHRFQRDLIDEALDGVASVLAEYNVTDVDAVHWPGWRTVIDADDKTWVRAEAGGLVEMYADCGDLVDEGDVVCTISNPFKQGQEPVQAPFDGLVVGVLQNPVVYPGNPICHLVELDDPTRHAYERNHGATTDNRSG